MRQVALSDQERLAWHRLAQSENVGPITFQKLLSRYGTATAALEAIPELSQRGGLRRPLKIGDAEKAARDLEKARALGATYLALCEPDYPELLRQSTAPPPLICFKGKVALLTTPALSIVGARNASAAGMRFTRMISSELAEAGQTIVSGLARGIDTAAHEAALPFATIAVVAGGIDHFYPPENAKLQQTIAEQGLLLTEMPPGIVPKAESFPRRNRIIAGLSAGTIVVEAAVRSGSLSTARFANEAGREVYAVPGSPLDPRCEGTNGLIKDGAQMLTRAGDALTSITSATMRQAFLFEEPTETAPAKSASAVTRERVLQLLSPTPIELDDLVREAMAETEDVLANLLELELAGLVQRQVGGRFVRAT